MNNLPNINYTVYHDLCTGCGICKSACPSHAIKITTKNGCFHPSINDQICKNDKGCHRCYDVCPGIGINLVKIAQINFKGTNNDALAGHYLKCFSGHSNDYSIRYHSASGGMVSQFLIYLLENNHIDGAVVTAFDKKAPLMVKSYIATTPQDILEAKSSKYSPVSLHGIIEKIKQAAGSRYVIVGLPCHIEGFRKYEALDKHYKEKIAGYFAIYCSSGRSFYLTEYIFKERGINRNALTYFAYRDNGCLGNMVARGEGIQHEERFLNYYHPLRSFFVPNRCTMCIDHYGELADVCFGDIHIAPYITDKIGVNSIIVRNPKMLQWLLEAQKAGSITLDEISVETVNKSQVMARIKKERNSTFIRINKILGFKTPQYDIDLKSSNQTKWLISYIHTCIQQFIGRNKKLWFLIPLLKKKAPKE